MTNSDELFNNESYKLKKTMNTIVKNYVPAVFAAMILSLLLSCKEKQSGDDVISPHSDNPVLMAEKPLYDEETKTFSLTMMTDSTAGATLTFTLMEGNNVLMENHDGEFRGIAPFEEGYDVKMEAQWDDTTIVRVIHVVDFIVPREPVTKMSATELAQLINKGDLSIRRCDNDHLSQGVKLVVTGSQMAPPQMLPDVIMLITNGVWKAVEIVNLEYDDNNLITSITLKPIGEQVVIDEDDEDFDF